MWMNINGERLQQIEKSLNEISYRNAIENSSLYNKRLVIDRRTRLPFIDSQTGVAQKDCSLWMQQWQRMPGLALGQLYTYPSKRWKKRRRGYLMNDKYLIQGQINTSNNNLEVSKTDSETTEKQTQENSKEGWSYQEFDDEDALLDGLDFEEPESDPDDSEEYCTRKRKYRKRKKKGDQIESEKPYACDVCDMRYKTRAGLSYHSAHSHNNEGQEETDLNSLKRQSPAETSQSLNTSGSQTSGIVTSTNTKNSQEESSINLQKNVENGKTKTVNPSPYCDFCLGDSDENKKSRSAEKLLSCADCGRSAHPTCLQFTSNMQRSVATYRWQCIECKSCGLCGNSDNDEQLLFCDDCDRGYHMFCLDPPLSEPPEGSWSCHLCIKEFHTPKK